VSDVLHAAVELQGGVLRMTGAHANIGGAVYVHVDDGESFFLQAELEHAAQSVPAQVGDSELLALGLRQ
jgi:hypothetical protein